MNTLLIEPNSTKAKKFFLVLMTAGGQQMPAALGTEGADNQISNEQRRYLSEFLPNFNKISFKLLTSNFSLIKWQALSSAKLFMLYTTVVIHR